jgi:hypothetical protein
MTLLCIDCLNGLTFAIPTFLHDYYLCQLQAFLVEFCGLSSTLWVGAMSCILFKQLKSSLDEAKRFAKISFFFICFVSFVISLVLALLHRFGEVLGHCWITDKDEGYIYRLSFLFGPIIIVLLVNLFIYRAVIEEIKEKTRYSNQLRFEGDVLIKRIRLYPVSMIICSLPLTLYRIAQIYYENIWIYAVGVFLYAFIGVSNSLIYGFNESVSLFVFKNTQKVERLVSID